MAVYPLPAADVLSFCLLMTTEGPPSVMITALIFCLNCLRPAQCIYRGGSAWSVLNLLEKLRIEGCNEIASLARQIHEIQKAFDCIGLAL